MRHMFESNIPLDNAEEVIDQAVDNLRQYCTSISKRNGGYHLDFKTSSAAIRAYDNGLLVSVGGDEVIDCDGTKTLIISQISRYAIGMPLCTLWVEASDERFAATRRKRPG